MRSFACEKKILETYCANVDASFEIGKKYSLSVGMFVGLVRRLNLSNHIPYLDLTKSRWVYFRKVQFV